MSASTTRAAVVLQAPTATQPGFAAINVNEAIGNLFRRGTTLSLVAVILSSLATSAFAQAMNEGQVFISPEDIKWAAAPPSMPKGAKIAVLQGDPGKPGPFVMRLMVPPGYKIAPHWHTQDESLTVISGTLYFGAGDKVETSKAHTATPGSFHFLSGKDHHYLVAKSEAVIQINGNGPFDVTYVNAAADLNTARK
jgi:quercetin dioxygenase-like cupin family protein